MADLGFAPHIVLTAISTDPPFHVGVDHSGARSRVVFSVGPGRRSFTPHEAMQFVAGMASAIDIAVEANAKARAVQ